jgi:hypothetical protein
VVVVVVVVVVCSASLSPHGSHVNRFPHESLCELCTPLLSPGSLLAGGSLCFFCERAPAMCFSFSFSLDCLRRFSHSAALSG